MNHETPSLAKNPAVPIHSTAPRPNFFIVGAPKCGTTAMWKYLDAHPDIFMPSEKEMHFFGRDLVADEYIRDPDAYFSQFKDASTATRIGEASVWYLYSHKAAEEIKAFDPDARILIMLRNPVDLLYSQHSQFLHNGNEDIENFADALAAEPDRKAGQRIPKGAHLVRGLFYRETVDFYPQVKRYLDTFGPAQIHITLYRDFRDQPAETYRAILEFLDVDPDFRPDFQVINPNKAARIRWLRRLLWHPPRAFEQLGRLLPESFRTRMVNRVRCYNTKYVPRPPMEPTLRRRLLNEFAPNADRLGALIGRDLSHWHPRSTPAT